MDFLEETVAQDMKLSRREDNAGNDIHSEGLWLSLRLVCGRGTTMYKLNPVIELINSPVVLILPDGEKKRYDSGAIAVEATYEKFYRISSIRAVGDEVEITLTETVAPTTNWIGEEQTFF